MGWAEVEADCWNDKAMSGGHARRRTDGPIRALAVVIVSDWERAILLSQIPGLFFRRWDGTKAGSTAETQADRREYPPLSDLCDLRRLCGATPDLGEISFEKTLGEVAS